MSCPARVLARLGPERVLVELAPDAAGGCAAGGRCRCAAATLGARAVPLRLECRLHGGALAGDPVEVELPRGGTRWALAALALYGLPALGLLVGVLVVERVAAPLAPFAALVGLGGGLFVAPRLASPLATSARAPYPARLCSGAGASPVPEEKPE